MNLNSDFGFRIGLAYEVFHALFELGVANFEVSHLCFPLLLEKSSSVFVDFERQLIDKNMSKDDRYPVDARSRHLVFWDLLIIVLIVLCSSRTRSKFLSTNIFSEVVEILLV